MMIRIMILIIMLMMMTMIAISSDNDSEMINSVISLSLCPLIDLSMDLS
jgi:hypothetical protein